ncbi:MAG: helix-turn-helix domain-containing protein [Proteobacteria bacterium]|nr:helix-turn-helix domain-containing protein [Pseudomonadota bacterium]MBI3495718.1 helix-turn-helix domain-containing protein [Pseudomonadota bacterium]
MRPRADLARIDATTAAELARQAMDDERAAQADAGAYARGIRHRLKLSQAAFARQIGVSVETVRNWEQGKRSPDQAARSLLRIVEREPEAVFRALLR